MSATDDLRRLLDERGVEWEGVGSVTFWADYSCCTVDGKDDDKVTLHFRCTPEYAIDVTLGNDEIDELKDDYCTLVRENKRLHSCLSDDAENAKLIMGENAKLREQLERVQPTDCEGNVLDIADTVSMLRSEYDGDHEWEDVVTELVLTKWGGDRWIVRGSKGEAWACDCTKTGYNEDAYEASDDAEPFDEPTLLEVENDKLRELVRDMWGSGYPDKSCEGCDIYDDCYDSAERLKNDGRERCTRCLFELRIEDRMRELGIEVNE